MGGTSLRMAPRSSFTMWQFCESSHCFYSKTNYFISYCYNWKTERNVFKNYLQKLDLQIRMKSIRFLKKKKIQEFHRRVQESQREKYQNQNNSTLLRTSQINSLVLIISKNQGETPVLPYLNYCEEKQYKCFKGHSYLKRDLSGNKK